MKVALLLSTYNWPEALELVLTSVLRQSRLPEEVFIADDGSESATKQIIKKFKEKYPHQVSHVWQEDKGFRKAKILNKAIARITADYVIQTDGDCMLHKNFIEDHLKFAKTNTYLYGSRVNIQKKFLPQLFQQQKIDFHYFSKGIKKRGRAVHLPFLTNLYKASPQLSSKVRGCNISYWKKDLIEVNGFNEEMEGWGKEDSELVIRLINKGVQGKRMKFSGIVFHIWHQEKSKDRLKKNKAIEAMIKKQNIVSIDKGLSQYL